jgi:hypothetical protein
MQRYRDSLTSAFYRATLATRSALEFVVLEFVHHATDRSLLLGRCLDHDKSSTALLTQTS